MGGGWHAHGLDVAARDALQAGAAGLLWRPPGGGWFPAPTPLRRPSAVCRHDRLPRWPASRSAGSATAAAPLWSWPSGSGCSAWPTPASPPAASASYSWCHGSSRRSAVWRPPRTPSPPWPRPSCAARRSAAGGGIELRQSGQRGRRPAVDRRDPSDRLQLYGGLDAARAGRAACGAPQSRRTSPARFAT